MRLRLHEDALQDLMAIVDFGIDHGMPDHQAYVGFLRERLGHLAAIKHPGRKGRTKDTREWVVPGTPYIAVFYQVGDVVTVARVLHGAQQWPPMAS